MHTEANNHKLPHMQRNWIAINLSLQLKTSLEIYCRIRYPLLVRLCAIEEKSVINIYLRADAHAYATHPHIYTHTYGTFVLAACSLHLWAWKPVKAKTQMTKACVCVRVCVCTGWRWLWIEYIFDYLTLALLVDLSLRLWIFHAALWHCQSPRWVPNSICTWLLGFECVWVYRWIVL